MTGVGISTVRRGSELLSPDIRVRAYQKYDGKEPDWAILDERNELIALIDVVNFHLDQKTDSYVRTAMAEGKVASPTIDAGADSLRFYQSVKNKCTVYKEIIESRNIPFIIGFFPQFEVDVDQSQIMESLYSEEAGLFRKGEDGGYPNVSGLVNYPDVAVAESPNSASHIYRFEYFPNYYAARPFKFPRGRYYPPMLISSAKRYKELITVTYLIRMLSQQMLSMMGRDEEDGPSMRLWLG